MLFLSVIISEAYLSTMEVREQKWKRLATGKIWSDCIYMDGEVNFYITQSLTEHGYVRTYLFRREIIISSLYWYYGEKNNSLARFSRAIILWKVEEDLPQSSELWLLIINAEKYATSTQCIAASSIPQQIHRPPESVNTLPLLPEYPF